MKNLRGFVMLGLISLFLASLSQNPVAGQQENPFAVSASVEAQDPFAPDKPAVTDNPFKADGKATSKDPARDREFTAKLRAYKNENRKLKHENIQLKNAANRYVELNGSITKSYLALLKQLLVSQDQDQQVLALETLLNLESKIALGDETKQRITQLADSDLNAKHLALAWLTRNDPDTVVRLGLQTSGPWIPISTNETNVKIQRALREPAFIDMDETELQEFIDMIQDAYHLNVVMSPEVDARKPITFKVSGLSLREAANLLLNDIGLSLHVHENHLSIEPKGRPDPQLTMVYNVKGLLNGQLSLDGIANQITEMIRAQDLAANVNPVDVSRLTITGSDSVHAKVSDLLGQLR